MRLPVGRGGVAGGGFTGAEAGVPGTDTGYRPPGTASYPLVLASVTRRHAQIHCSCASRKAHRAPHMPLISLRDVSIAFGGPPVLDGANLGIDRGERVCLLGRNGAGKSTL